MNKRGFAPLIVVVGLIIGVCFVFHDGSEVKSEIIDSQEQSGQLATHSTPADTCSKLGSYESLLSGMCFVMGGDWECSNEMIGCLDFSPDPDVCQDSQINNLKNECSNMRGDFRCSETEIYCKL